MKIIAKGAFERFNNAKMIAFLHKNPITAENEFDLAVALHKEGMMLKYYGRSTIEFALNGTKFECVKHLFRSSGFLIFSPEIKVGPLLKIVKKTPQVILMGKKIDLVFFFILLN